MANASQRAGAQFSESPLRLAIGGCCDRPRLFTLALRKKVLLADGSFRGRSLTVAFDAAIAFCPLVKLSPASLSSSSSFFDFCLRRWRLGSRCSSVWLPKNPRRPISPQFARLLRRWHISLSTFMRLPHSVGGTGTAWRDTFLHARDHGTLWPLARCRLDLHGGVSGSAGDSLPRVAATLATAAVAGRLGPTMLFVQRLGAVSAQTSALQRRHCVLSGANGFGGGLSKISLLPRARPYRRSFLGARNQDGLLNRRRGGGGSGARRGVPRRLRA